MHEGRNIHFSPVDKKPLCSYSNKLCRQRRLNGYAFCIRHILEDKSAPFKQCSFVTRNNCQKCLNAIPANQERGYCHSHMQVVGIIPKTERKSKLPATSLANSGKTVLKKSNSSNRNTSSANDTDPCSMVTETSTISKDGIYDYDDDSLSSPPLLLLKGKLTSSSNCNDKMITSFKEISSIKGGGAEDFTTEISKTYNNKSSPPYAVNNIGIWAIHRKRKTVSTNKDDEKGDNSLLSQAQHTEPLSVSNIGGISTMETKPKQMSANPTIDDDHLTCSLVQDKWRNFKFNDTSLTDEDMPLPFHQYEQMKTLKILKKLPLFADGPLLASSPLKNAKEGSLGTNCSSTRNPISKSNIKCDSRSIIAKSTALEILMTPPFLNLSMNEYTQKISNECSDDDAKLEGICIGTGKKLCLDEIGLKESRKQFLCRVRRAFKLQYRSIKKACKISEKHEKRDKGAFRTSLLSCVMNNPRFCAQVLVHGNNVREESCEHYIAANRVTITNLSNHLRNLSAQKLIINESKSKNASVVSATSNNQLQPNKDKISHLINEKCADPLVKLIEVGNSVNDNNIHNLNSIWRREEKVIIKSKMDNAPIDGSTKAEHNAKQKFCANVSDIAISKKEIDSPSLTQWDLQEGNMAIKSAVNENVTKSSVLSEILQSTLISASLRKRRKNGYIDLPIVEAHDATPTLVKAEVVDSWIPEASSQACSPCLVNQSQSSSNGNTKSPSHNHNQPTENCSASSESNIIQQIKVTLNSNERTVTMKLGSTSLDIGDSSKDILADTCDGSPFDQSSSNHRGECDFSDEDLDQNFALQLDPEITQQASRLLEENELTEDDFNELFPETRLSDQKLVRADLRDLPDLGIDFASNIDTSDVDYSLFANIFPNVTRSIQHSSVFVNNQF